jgi:predicted nucleic acid-binding protein
MGRHGDSARNRPSPICPPLGLIEDLGPAVALDTEVFIYFIEEDERLLPVLRPVFESIATSGLTLMEVLVVPYRSGNLSLADRYEALLTRSRASVYRS